MALSPALRSLFRDRAHEPRLQPLPEAEWSPEAVDAIRLAGAVVPPGLPTPALFATLAHHPRLYARWNLFAGRLLKGDLPARDRELVIVRSLWHTQCQYEWEAHCSIALVAGVTEDELEQLAVSEFTGFEATDRALIESVDQLHHHADIDDVRWQVLAQRYSERELIEILMLVGQYHLVGFLTNALRFVPEAGVADAFNEPNVDKLDPSGFFR